MSENDAGVAEMMVIRAWLNIGLMLCKEFVTDNGGAIWVEAEEGRGSTFYFSLKSNENGA